MTLEKLKELYLTARKNNDVTDKNILQCLIADIELENSRGKNCDPITMINKFIKNAKTNLELTNDQKSQRDQRLVRRAASISQGRVYSEELPTTWSDERSKEASKASREIFNSSYSAYTETFELVK